MAKSNRNQPKSVLKTMISESLQDLKNGDFEEDPRLGHGAEQLTGPQRFEKGQKAKDEAVIDVLLSGIKDKVGYFLKLKKEVRPNEYMLMKTIESEWRTWPDMEVAISDIVKTHTKLAPAKWGTGQYRIEFGCKGGIRGENYPDANYYINAEEEFLSQHQLNGMQNGTAQVIPPADPAVQVAAQIDTLSNLVNMLKGIFPTAPNPADTQAQIATAFKEGMTLKVNDGNNSSQMMTAMMTGLIGMMTTMMQGRQNEPRVVNPDEGLNKTLEVLKNFGVLGNNNNQQPKGLMDLITELKVLGIDLFKKEDPMESIGKLKQFASLASEMMGMGGGTAERPSILEKIVDVLGPALPKIINDIKETAGNAVTAQQLAGQNMRLHTSGQIQQIPQGAQPAPVPFIQTPTRPEEQTTYSRMKGNGGDVAQNPQVNPQQSEQIKQFFSSLHSAAQMNNKLFYPIIYSSLLQDEKGTLLIDGIVKGTSTAKDLIDMLQSYGDERFKDSTFVMKSLVGYVNGFITWIRQMAGQPAVGEQPAQVKMNTEYAVKCGVCGTMFSFDSESDFLLDEQKTCGQNSCTGALSPVMGA